MNEKRLTSRLIKYWWEMLREDRPLPLWEEFDREAFADVWEQCCGWSVAKDGSGTNMYTFTYVGDAVKEVVGSSPDDDGFMSKFRDLPEARIVERIEEVVNLRYPVTDEGECLNNEGVTIKFRSCLLPFATRQSNVIEVVLGLSWKAF